MGTTPNFVKLDRKVKFYQNFQYGRMAMTYESGRTHLLTDFVELFHILFPLKISEFLVQLK